jgi:hypothetical protein
MTGRSAAGVELDSHTTPAPGRSRHVPMDGSIDTGDHRTAADATFGRFRRSHSLDLRQIVEESCFHRNERLGFAVFTTAR